MGKLPGRFMVAVGAIIESTLTRRILLLKRSENRDFAPLIWEEVTGRVHQFEELEEALKREVLEETGIGDLEVVKPLTVNHFYRGEKTEENEMVLIIYWCRSSSEKVRLSEEHSEYRWLDPQEAFKLTEHPGVKNDIRTFIREKKPTPEKYL